jgi:hypothetical protein
LGSIASAVENQGKAGLAASKVLAISELAISTAVSIGQAIAGATSAASAGGPAAPFFVSVIYFYNGWYCCWRNSIGYIYAK